MTIGLPTENVDDTRKGVEANKLRLSEARLGPLPNWGQRMLVMLCLASIDEKHVMGHSEDIRGDPRPEHANRALKCLSIT